MPDGPLQVQINKLERLARARFPDPPLSEAEEKLIRAAPKGEFAFCGPNANWDDPANDPSKAEEWGADREIRAELIRWLCVNWRAKKLVDPRGIQVICAKISDSIDLDNVIIPFRVALFRCRLTHELTLRGTQVPVLSLPGTRARAITADGVVVKGAVFLRDDFRAEGEVRFLGARIGGNLECDGATFENRAQDGVAGGNSLNVDGAVVKGGVFLRNGFSAKGEVRLLNAQIGGHLDCNGATFENPSGYALNADSAVVKGSIFLMSGLNAKRKAGVRFSAKGDVRLPGVEIGGDLACVDAKISGAVIADTAVIKGTFFWVRIDPKETALDLSNASVGSLVDDKGSWPTNGNLDLDGFVYGRISVDPKDAKTRLCWLARQKSFAPQPYRQLAKVLRDEGNDAGARRVLFEMEDLRRAQEDPWYVRPWGWILRGTIGYGYYPGLSLAWLLFFVLLGWPFFRCAYFSGDIAPTDKEAYHCFQNDHHPPAYYERFYASIYSLEKTFPLIKLGQVDLWHPAPNRPPPNPATANPPCPFASWLISAEFLRLFGWLQTVVGWFLATLFAAGVTGVVRND
jgi:hypothetical protein